MSEMIDIFDAKFNHIGIKDRKTVHKMGYWHQTFHCWILMREKNEEYVVFQIRDKRKDVAPNKLDITAAGHLKAGETKEDGLREIEEELGLKVNYNRLKYLGIRITASENHGQINKEFAHVYLLQNDAPLENYNFTDGEVAGLVKIKVSDGLKLCSFEEKNIPCTILRKKGNCNSITESFVEFSQFIPRIDSYYYKIFIMAERYFNGNPYLSI